MKPTISIWEKSTGVLISKKPFPAKTGSANTDFSLGKQGIDGGPWLPRIKCGAGPARVYPEGNRGGNDKAEAPPQFQNLENFLKNLHKFATFFQ